MTQPVHIAVLMACHNRKDTTLRALSGLMAQKSDVSFSLDVWLVDDGSTDGTGDAVSSAFPAVHLIRGDGNLYWCGGMRLAWDRAAKQRADAWLWLNDDVELNDWALDTLLQAMARNPKAVVVGSCACPVTQRHAYGGQRKAGRHPARLTEVVPADHDLPCDTFEGNLVLIPDFVFRSIGGMAPFTHAMADTDYGLRASRRGYRPVIAPGHLGSCPRNPRDRGWLAPGLKVAERWQRILSPKGLPPRDWLRFCWNHGGLLAPLFFLGPYCTLLRHCLRPGS